MNVIIGTTLLWAWRILGLLLWPVLILHPRARRHIVDVPHPVPGWTWVHGASLGEHRVVNAIAEHLGPHWVTSSSWRTPVAGAFPAPLDLPGVIGPWLDRARPGRIVLAEGALWPGWLIAARKRGIPVVVVSGRKGPGWRRWQRLGPVFPWLTRGVIFLSADEWGDLKAAAPQPRPFTLRQPCIIGASTHEEDESKLIDAWQSLAMPRPLLVLAPRRIERAQELQRRCREWTVELRTSGSTGADADILIVDTLGELNGLAPQASIALIGGTFDAAMGGHSPMEAMKGNAHIVAGPFVHANDTAWTLRPWHRWDPTNPTQQLAALLSMDPPQAAPSAPVSADLINALPAAVKPASRAPRPWAWPLVPAWTLLSRLHRSLQLGPKADGRTVVVGGLVNGGAGRTPTVGWIADQIPGSIVMSAGYRRARTGPTVRTGAPDQPPSFDLGDELEMLRRRGLRTVSDPQRNARASALQSAPAIIVDGGLGDPSLRNGFRIACIDGHASDAPFPAGDRRLPWSALNGVDAVWLQHADWAPEMPAHIPVVRAKFCPSHWLHRGVRHPLDAVSGSVDAAVGIAAPERFVCTLLTMGLTVSSVHRVRDHGRFTALPPGSVVTEKDAARLPADADAWALVMRWELEGGDALLTTVNGRLS